MNWYSESSQRLLVEIPDYAKNLTTMPHMRVQLSRFLPTRRLQNSVNRNSRIGKYSSSSRISVAENNDAKSDIDAIKEPKNKWDYDILINGGGIVGVTFAAQVLQKTSNKLKIGERVLIYKRIEVDSSPSD